MSRCFSTTCRGSSAPPSLPAAWNTSPSGCASRSIFGVPSVASRWATVRKSRYAHAQRFRRWYCKELTALFRTVDVILAPATPYPAFPIGQAVMEVGGRKLPAAGHLGVYTQPLSFAGLPVVAAPIAGIGPLPLGVQIVAAPWREDLALRVAAAAEAIGAVASPSPTKLHDAR